MASNAITATVVVQFNGPPGYLTAEIDGRSDGLNGGRSNFQPGDDVFILVKKAANVTIEQVITSVGSCSADSGNDGFTTEEEYVTFVRTLTGSIGKPLATVTGGPTWYGENLGAVKTTVGSTELVLTDPLSATKVGVLYLKYTSSYLAYRLTGIPSSVNGKKSFQVVVAFIGKVDD